MSTRVLSAKHTVQVRKAKPRLPLIMKSCNIIWSKRETPNISNKFEKLSKNCHVVLSDFQWSSMESDATLCVRCNTQYHSFVSVIS